MKSSRYTVSPAAELSAGMKNRKYNFHSRQTRLVVNPNRNSPSVIYNCDGIIFIDRHLNHIAVSGKRFVHRIVYNFINQMIQAFPRGTSDIHTRALTHCFETFQHGNTAGIIRFFFWHNCSILAYVLLSFSLKNTSVCPILGHSILLYHFSSRNSKIFFRRKNLLRSSAP